MPFSYACGSSRYLDVPGFTWTGLDVGSKSQVGNDFDTWAWTVSLSMSILYGKRSSSRHDYLCINQYIIIMSKRKEEKKDNYTFISTWWPPSHQPSIPYLPTILCSTLHMLSKSRISVLYAEDLYAESIVSVLMPCNKRPADNMSRPVTDS